jgi:hypothetical protein
MEVVFVVVLGDILIGTAPEYGGLLPEWTGASPAHCIWLRRDVVLGAVSLLVLLPLAAMRSMERLAVVNIIGECVMGGVGVYVGVLRCGKTACAWRRPICIMHACRRTVSVCAGRLTQGQDFASVCPCGQGCWQGAQLAGQQDTTKHHSLTSPWLACLPAGVASNGVFAGLMLALAAGALNNGVLQPPPLFPDWSELGSTPVAAAITIATVVPVLLNCDVCHQSLHPLMPLLQVRSIACCYKQHIQQTVCHSLSVLLQLQQSFTA